MRSRLRSLVGATVGLAAASGRAIAHPDHSTPTPSGPLAGVPSAGAGVALAGLLVLTGALLLAREGTISGRARGAGIGIGTALLAVGAVVAMAFP